MRVFLFCFLLLAGLYGYAQKEQKRAIAFYNVENLFDTINDPYTDDDAFTPKGAYKYTDEVYRKKLRNIAGVLKQLAANTTAGVPVLIGLAEIENEKVLSDLVNENGIKSYAYRHISYDSPDPRGIDVALLYHPKSFRLLSSRPVKVSIDHNGIAEATRDILYVTGLLDKDTIHVLVNHWPSRREGIGETAPKRAQLALVNKHFVDSLTKRNPKCKIIIMGDMNDDPTDISVANILGAKGGRDGIKPQPLYNPWTDMYLAGRGSTAYRKKWNLFDQIILSRSFLYRGPGWKFSQVDLFDRDFLKTTSGKQQGYPFRSWRGYHWMNGYSDHFPVVLYLENNQ